jgi:hypothetical protein
MMSKSYGLKLLGTLGSSVTLALAACGGGGNPGVPAVPVTSPLMITPELTGLTMTAGYSTEPGKISGGQKPYYAAASGTVEPTLLDDGTLYLYAYAPTPRSSSSDTCATLSKSNWDYVWVQDSSYCATHPSTTAANNICSTTSGTSTGSSGQPTTSTAWEVIFPVCADAAPSTSLSTLSTASTSSPTAVSLNSEQSLSFNAFTVIPPIQTLAEGSTDSATFTLANFTGPFYIAWPSWANGLIAVSPPAIGKPTNPTAALSFQVALVSGACVKSEKNIPLTITDAVDNASSTVTVVVQNTNPNNATNPSCF